MRLEEASIHAQAEKQEAVAAAAGEIQELKSMCQALRNQVDRLQGGSQ
jgi:hypothetical protein